MNKLLQNLFMVLFPLYPFWAWLTYSYTQKPIEFFVSIILLPIALYFVLYVNKKLPYYLILFLCFTFYHLSSVYINDTFPKDTNKVYFLLSDPNILACLFFIVIEYTTFSPRFIKKMNRNILLIVIVSMVVSLIQISIPTFFFNTSSDEELLYVGESRNFSIYSWTNINSAGITFPILVSIMVSVYEKKAWALPLVILSGVVTSFLTRARYVMLSALLVLSQMFFNTRKSLSKRASLLLFFVGGLVVIILLATYFGFDLQEVINTRILEKDSDMASAKARVISYDVFKIVFPEHPWFGVGPETKKDVIDLLQGEAPLIHVGYLSYLYFYGVAGCLFFFLALFFLIRDAFIVGRRKGFWGSFYGLVAFCLANTTFVYFNCSEMGIVLAVIYIRYYQLTTTTTEEDEEEEVDEEEDIRVLQSRAYLAGIKGD